MLNFLKVRRVRSAEEGRYNKPAFTARFGFPRETKYPNINGENK
jgi:hypothetical protein